MTVTDDDDCEDSRHLVRHHLKLSATVHWEGRYDLHTGEVDIREFRYNGEAYQLLGPSK